MSNYFNDKGTIGFTCDICGRELNGCSIVNGMKFCAKCYQETFGKDNQQNEIQQLKQQLEEKDEQIKRRVMVYEGQFIEQADEIYSLKQQLAEKDKEIERLKFFEKAHYYSQLQASQEDIQKFQQLANQSAVNINYIAIQELEKIKIELKNKIKLMNDKEHCYQQKVVSWEDICNLINNRIKELKGE